MEVIRAITFLAIVVATALTLSNLSPVLIPKHRTLTWDDALRLSELKGGSVSVSDAVSLSYREITLNLNGRKALVRVLRLCGFGNLTPNLSLNGWLLELGPEGETCIISVPIQQGEHVTFFSIHPSIVATPIEARSLDLRLQAAEVKVYENGKVRRFIVRTTVVSSCPCRE